MIESIRADSITIPTTSTSSWTTGYDWASVWAINNVSSGYNSLASSKEPQEKTTVKKSIVNMDRLSRDVKDVKVYNDRVVQVFFKDGTFEKSVCAKDDVFSFETGLTICLFKYLLRDSENSGTKLYNKLIRNIYKTLDDNEKMKERKSEEKKIKLRQAAKEESRRVIRKERRRRELREDIREAIRDENSK